MINVLDFETYKQNEMVIPYCLCILLKNQPYYFYINDEKNLNYKEESDIFIRCINFVVNSIKEEKIEFYIHNLDFDGFLIITSLTKNLINFKIYSEKRKLFMIRVDYCGKMIYFKCSYKIIPMSLEKLGNLENFPKKFFPYKFVNSTTLNYIGKIPSKDYWNENDLSSFLLDKNNDYEYDLKKETIDYCINDILLTNKVLKNLFSIVDEESASIRKKSLSSPSMSYNIFLKKYNNFNISSNLKLEEDSYIRKAYFGGRCEVFGNIYDNEKIKYFDFSGMYGQCMLENFHYGDYRFESPNEIKKPGFYNIDYKSNFKELPILPCHYEGKLMFANGERSGTFWFEEILLFINLGGIVTKINNAFIYDNFGVVFRDFIEKFTEIRKKEGYYKIFGKLMVNSLYGSMGLKKKDTLQFITFSEEEFHNILNNTSVSDFFKVNDCFIILIQDDYKAKHFFYNIEKFNEMSLRNVSYAAAIASKARIKLYKAILEVIEDGGRVLYCDTDSIFAAYPINDDRTEAGSIKWIDFYNDAVFAAPKTYAIKQKNEEIIKIKGVEVKDINFKNFKKKFYENEKIIFNDQLNFRKSEYILKQYYIEKEIWLNNYNKREFCENKKQTKPILIK